MRRIMRAVVLTAGAGAMLGAGACSNVQFPPENTRCRFGVCIASKTGDAAAIGIDGFEFELLPLDESD